MKGNNEIAIEKRWVNTEETRARDEVAKKVAEAVDYLKAHGWVSVTSEADIIEEAKKFVEVVKRYVAPTKEDDFCSRSELMNTLNDFEKKLK